MAAPWPLFTGKTNVRGYTRKGFFHSPNTSLPICRSPSRVSKGHRERTLKTIGDYELLKQIGDGGVATVYQGRHRTTQQIVAIKIIKPDQADERTLKRFRLEFQATSRLEHPHIARGIEFGQSGSTCYLVMEYLPGGSLGELIARRGRLPEVEALRIITQVGQALHYAHQQGLIHRDVKPDNILLNEQGEAKLTDLGLMKVLDNDMNLTQPEACVGTPNFIPPEQFDDAKNADPRCDVYSLGATLYMAITGVRPFDAKATMAVLRKKMLNDIVPPQELVPGLTPRVGFAISRAVLADPKKRFGSCEEFLLALNGTVPAPSTAAGVQTERRAEPRYPANWKCSCRPASSKEESVPAVIREISASGVRLLADQPFEKATMLLVRLEGARPPMPSIMVVKVVWTAPDPSGKCILGCASDTVLRDAELRAIRSSTAAPIGEFPSKARSHA